jgi:hypothetical protein
MVKPEWGAQAQLPKCGERFYDLAKDDPVVCIECGNQWYPEPVLKVEAADPVRGGGQGERAEEADSDLAADDLDAELETSTRKRIRRQPTSTSAATTISAFPALPMARKKTTKGLAKGRACS